VGKEAEVIPESKEHIFVNPDPAFVKQIAENPAVLSQETVNIPYIVVGVAVDPVVVVVSALI